MAIEDVFPQLRSTGYRETSPASPAYNCIAWAAGHDDAWWDPTSYPGYYWPQGLPLSDSAESLVQLYAGFGFILSDSAELEPGFEKIAIYGDWQGYTHAARQLETGKWTSKLGTLEDIEHDSLQGLEGQEYGKVKYVLKRPRR